MPCKLQNLSGFSHLIKICPAPKQDEGAYEVWYGLTKFAGKKSQPVHAHLYHGNDDRVFRKIRKNLPRA